MQRLAAANIAALRVKQAGKAFQQDAGYTIATSYPLTNHSVSQSVSQSINQVYFRQNSIAET